MAEISDKNTSTITLLINSSEENLVSETESQFGIDNVSQSSNFIGGVSIAVFLGISMKSLRIVIKNILDFLAQRRDRYDDAQIVYDGKKIEMKGYSPEDVEKILSNPVFEKLRQQE